jgi:hypothetical protein
VTGFTMVGGPGMSCEGDSCTIPEADAVTGTPDAGATEPAGVSAE